MSIVPTVGTTLDGGCGGTPHDQIHQWLAEQTGITIDTSGNLKPRAHARHHMAIEEHILGRHPEASPPDSGYGIEVGHDARHQWEIDNLQETTPELPIAILKSLGFTDEDITTISSATIWLGVNDFVHVDVSHIVTNRELDPPFEEIARSYKLVPNDLEETDQ